MVRTPLTPEERRRGERLGALLREARGGRSMVEIAASAGISAETLRKIETGRGRPPPPQKQAGRGRGGGRGVWGQGAPPPP
ncbi:helix-turn-helix domain-containing protein, partial [Streptomyces sp. NPDC059153]|uniref:helix-turn-helix domain-containing protein n=1 Tax=Streptomyces sp. NPDC059153 TaxID=3346743 RepID=UPI003693CEFB